MNFKERLIKRGFKVEELRPRGPSLFICPVCGKMYDGADLWGFTASHDRCCEYNDNAGDTDLL